MHDNIFSCKNRPEFDYANLPLTSVVVVFYNEPISLVTRTIYSILHTAPDHLLDEIILVDDASDNGKFLFSNILWLKMVGLFLL